MCCIFTQSPSSVVVCASSDSTHSICLTNVLVSVLVLWCMCLWDVGVRNSYIKQETKNVFVVFHTFEADVVRSSQLVSTINTPHVLIVESHTSWTGYGESCSIFSVFCSQWWCHQGWLGWRLR